MKKLCLCLFMAILPAESPAAEPAVVVQLGTRNGFVTPERSGCTHTAAGNILVAQPTPDVVVITMTGVVVASGHPFYESHAAQNFDLTQEMKITFDEAKIKKVRLEMEGRVVGLLRADAGHHSHTGGAGPCSACGSAQQGAACAALTCGKLPVTSLCVDPHPVACGEYLSVNCQTGPVCVPVGPGCYTLHQTFHIEAAHPHSLLPCNPASAEFAPDALDPTWISYWEPFRAAVKRDFGFQVTLRFVPE
jgi:hypothetical protein